ncbi:MAG: putative toxin-antitoxin system toxin component, PIN family [Candidatus Eremiobacter antarcticus]|nr:putative toxin-antitoxin system toxin component, PIN family [Candidatus Eremiobacteraeota bacterium]MBC5807105.1 putative toxin-antitoxin system toxin component, PIN family [Candidatus Eremiobacteraeota bacterium]
MRKPRLVLDTNVWISALLNKNGAPFRIVSRYSNGEIEIITSEALLEELREVLSRRRFEQKYRITREDIEAYTAMIRQRAVVVETTGGVFGCEDPDDDVAIETAIKGRADAVVSGDAHLTGDYNLVALLN